MARGEDIWEYTYDNGGNLLSVSLNGTAIKTYGYGDANWKDKLTSYNGQELAYDEIGNPLNYRDGMSFTWQNGRQLAGISTAGWDGTSGSISYTYNAEGLRTSKTVNGRRTDYYVLEGVLLGQKTGNETIYFLYDENGSAYGFRIKNGTEEAYYYYEFNLQGDVAGILDASGTKVVEYAYGAWGDILSITGAMADTVGQKNPLRYRGYYYDDETGFYYVSSRYYDPEVGRFISADSAISGTGESVQGYNLYAYCFNNPVNMSDPDGNWPSWAKKVAIGVAVIAAVAVVAVATAGTGTAVACFAAGALKGAIIGGVVGAAVGGTSAAVKHRVKTGSWKGAGKAARDGAQMALCLEQ